MHEHDWKRRTIWICACGDVQTWKKEEAKTKGRGRPRVEHPDWIEMYQRPMRIADIAAEAGVGRSRVYQYLHRSGIPMRDERVHNGRSLIPHERRTPEDLVEAIRLYEEDGLTFAEIGRRFGVSRERIRQWFENAGKGDAFQRRLETRIAAKPKTYTCRWCDEEVTVGTGRVHWASGKHVQMRWGTEEAARYWEGAAEDYRSGMLTKDICAKWDIDMPSLMRTVKFHGIPLRRPNDARVGTREESRLRKDRIVEMTQKGYTIPEIAALLLCSTSWVSLALKERGVAPVRAIPPKRRRNR